MAVDRRAAAADRLAAGSRRRRRCEEPFRRFDYFIDVRVVEIDVFVTFRRRLASAILLSVDGIDQYLTSSASVLTVRP